MGRPGVLRRWCRAFGFRAGEDRLPTLPEYVRPLRRVGLVGKKFLPGVYQDRLADYLGISIETVWLSAGDHPLLYSKLIQSGDAGLLLRGKRSGNAIIVILETLPYSQKVKTWYHELEHIARGHALAARATYAFEHRSLKTILDGYASRLEDEAEDAEGELWVPEKSLLDRPPVLDLDYCNREAELCAGYAITAGARGSELFDSERYLFSRRF